MEEESPVLDEVYNTLHSIKIEGTNAAMAILVVVNSMQGAIMKKARLSLISRVENRATTKARTKTLLYIEMRIHLDSIKVVLIAQVL